MSSAREILNNLPENIIPIRISEYNNVITFYYKTSDDGEELETQLFGNMLPLLYRKFREDYQNWEPT